MDKSKENWKKIIDRENINWLQISDLQFWKSPVAKTYGIEELPYNLILNTSGKIIAINIHGEELKAFITNELKKNSNNSSKNTNILYIKLCKSYLQSFLFNL